MDMRHPQILRELKKLRAELSQASPAVAPAKLERIDELLDERLDQMGVHPAECGCRECRKVVCDLLMRRHLGELLDSRDLASTDEWGTAG